MGVWQNNPVLIVGLGNPGEEYVHTRHNVGFDAIDLLLERLPGKFNNQKGFNSNYFEGRFKGQNLVLEKPVTYMNLSGRAVAQMARRMKLEPKQILLIYDDMDLPLGRMRLRKNGGSAGHNGVKSVIEELGAQSFPRLRIGIGRKQRGDHIDHVLSGFTGDERQRLTEVLNAAVEAVILTISRGVGAAMNEYNGKTFGDDDKTEIGADAEK